MSLSGENHKNIICRRMSPELINLKSYHNDTKTRNQISPKNRVGSEITSVEISVFGDMASEITLCLENILQEIGYLLHKSN